jgi:hypothetical protein
LLGGIMVRDWSYGLEISVLTILQASLVGFAIVPAASRLIPMLGVVRDITECLPFTGQSAVVGFPGTQRISSALSLVAFYVGITAAAGLGGRVLLPNDVPVWLSFGYVAIGMLVALVAWLWPLTQIRARLQDDKWAYIAAELNRIRSSSGDIDWTDDAAIQSAALWRDIAAEHEVRVPWLAAVPVIIGVLVQIVPLVLQPI